MLPLIATTRMRLLEAGRWSVLLCLFSIPLSKAAISIFMFLALLGSLAGPLALERFRAASRQPVVIGAAVWFAVLAVSALHAPAYSDRWNALGHYITFLYPLIVASLLQDSAWRKRGLLAFGVSASILLALSWAQLFGIDPMHQTAQEGTWRFTVLNDYTHEGIVYMALAAMAAAFAQSATRITHRRVLWFIAAAAIADVVFLLQSRTAYLALAPMLAYGIWRFVAGRYAGWRAIALGLGVLTLIGSTVLLSPRMQQRVKEAQQDVTNYASRGAPTSMGIRLELWKQTLPIISAAPLLGHGLGLWKSEYDKQIKGLTNYDAFIMGHPHQEALLIIAEEGWLGFTAWVLLLVFLAKYTQRLDPAQRDFYHCLLIIYVAAGLANCIIVDSLHRHLFVMLLACIPFIPKPGAAPVKPASA